jgi:hypothetical protein
MAEIEVPAGTTVLGPQKGPQTDFLSSPADIAIYGGAAGGGKSFGLLLDPLRYIGVPGFRAVLFRRTMPQITNAGGLLDTSQEIYPLVRGELRAGNQPGWVWGGARIDFRHLQHEQTKLNWQGAQVPWIGLDELTHFTEGQFWYMLSRNRSACGVKPCIRATCNPSPGWVRELLGPWVIPGWDGPGGPAESGEIRYITRKDGQLLWVDKSWRDNNNRPAKSITFIRSSIHDNRKLLDVDPDYLANLQALPEIERRRLLEGDWNVFEGAFFAEFSEAAHSCLPPYLPGKLPRHWRPYGGLDWGYRDPFAFVLRAIDERGVSHTIESIQRRQLTNEEQAALVVGVLTRWGIEPRRCPISADESMWNRKTVNGVKAEPDITAFHKVGLACVQSKAPRRHGWMGLRKWMHAPGRFQIWKGYNDELLRALPLLPWADSGEDADTKADDHLADALRYSEDVSPLPPPDPTPVPHVSAPVTAGSRWIAKAKRTARKDFA